MTRRRQGQLLLNACRWTPARIERWRRELEARGPLSVEDEQPLDDWMRWNIHRLTDAHCCSVPRRSFAVSNKIPMAPGGDALSLVAKLRQLEERLRAIDGELASCRPIPPLDPAVIEDRLTEWRRLLRASKTQG